RRPDRARARDPAADRPGLHEPGDRRTAVPERPHHRGAPPPHPRQAPPADARRPGALRPRAPARRAGILTRIRPRRIARETRHGRGVVSPHAHPRRAIPPASVTDVNGYAASFIELGFSNGWLSAG